MSSASHQSSSREERLNALILELTEAWEQGRAPDPQEYIRRHPEFAAAVPAHFANQDWFRNIAGQLPESALESRLQAARDAEEPAEAGAPTAATRAEPASHSGAPTLMSPADGAPTKAGTPTVFGVHELLHEIARGGM